MSSKKTLNKVSQAEKGSGEGLIVIVSAPSGCGKTTLIERLLKRHPDWVRSISATTRTMRSGEREAIDYFFIDNKTFEEMKSKGNFLEFAQVHGHYYGTPRSFVMEKYEAGKTVVLAIDVQGMKQIKKVLETKCPLLTVFVLPPSLKVLRERLEGRKTDNPEAIEKRLQIAEVEIKEAHCYDHTIVNHQLEEVIAEIDQLIAQYQKTRRS